MASNVLPLGPQVNYVIICFQRVCMISFSCFWTSIFGHNSVSILVQRKMWEGQQNSTVVLEGLVSKV